MQGIEVNYNQIYSYGVLFVTHSFETSLFTDIGIKCVERNYWIMHYAYDEIIVEYVL